MVGHSRFIGGNTGQNGVTTARGIPLDIRQWLSSIAAMTAVQRSLYPLGCCNDGRNAELLWILHRVEGYHLVPYSFLYDLDKRFLPFLCRMTRRT
jgi:hypothetical protein